MTTGNPREAYAAGQFYPSSEKELKDEIKKCFLSELGPKALPVKKKSRLLAGLIVPHAGYAFSGPCAAWAYKELAESMIPDTYVILGTDHKGFGSCVSLLDWKTPLGTAENDREFGILLNQEGVPVNEEAHSKEHSIEVQVPFLQFINSNPKIVPIIVSEEPDYKKIAEAISILLKDKKLRKKLGKNARKTIEENYTWNAVSSRILGYYELLVRDKL